MGGPKILTAGYWSESGIRLMVMFSLSLQIILVLLGNRRKHSQNKWVRLFLWFAYFFADEVAITTLGLLSREFLAFPGDNRVNKNHATIAAFWAPFLVLQLGGPDTMTAYSLEDNQLWQRHYVTLMAQLVFACIIFEGAWTTDPLHWKMVAATMAMFVAGIIKSGERIWVQRSAHSDRFRNSMFPEPDPDPNYARHMDKYRSKREEGYKVSSGRINEAPTVGDHIYSYPKNSTIPDAANLQDAYAFFSFCKQMFADLILSVHEIVNSRSYFQNRSYEEVFKVVEIELGFIYDVVYTKTVLVFSIKGCVLRALIYILLVSSLVSFRLHDGRHEAKYSRMDIITTYILLGGAISLELFSSLLLFSSDWTMLWLSKHRSRVLDFFYKAISSLHLSTHKRWSNAIGQRNLLESCLNAKHSKNKNGCFTWKSNPAPLGDSTPDEDNSQTDIEPAPQQEPEELRISPSTSQQQVEELRISPSTSQQQVEELRISISASQKLIEAKKHLEDLRSTGMERVRGYLKEVIFQQLLKKPSSARRDIRARRARWNLESTELSKRCPEGIRWSIDEAEFDESILLWHIATDLCFHKDFKTNGPLDGFHVVSVSNSKLLSGYMLYLLIEHRAMLPNGIGQIRYQDTSAELIEFFDERKLATDVKEASESLMDVSTEVPPSEVKGDRSKSVLFDACRLAKELQSLDLKPDWGRKEKWEFISHVWVEILSYAAGQCQSNQHVRQLCQGGELLTHVWLLMAHLGITDQFQISKGHGRAKLIVK